MVRPQISLNEYLMELFQDMNPDVDIEQIVDGEDLGEDGSIPNGMPLGAIFSNLFNVWLNSTKVASHVCFCIQSYAKF